MLPMDFCNKFSPSDREERALKLLHRVGLVDLAHKLPGAVSGGQQQSAAVARALANDPPIIIADEPTGNLDSKTAEEVIQLFEEVVSQGKTIIMVTHDRVLAERTQRTILISDGELINPTIAKAFSGVSHKNLLKLTHLAEKISFTADEIMAASEKDNGHLFILESGSAKLEGVKAKRRSTADALEILPDQPFYFTDPKAGLTLQAKETPTTGLTLSCQDLINNFSLDCQERKEWRKL